MMAHQILTSIGTAIVGIDRNALTATNVTVADTDLLVAGTSS